MQRQSEVVYRSASGGELFRVAEGGGITIPAYSVNANRIPDLIAALLDHAAYTKDSDNRPLLDSALLQWEHTTIYLASFLNRRDEETRFTYYEDEHGQLDRHEIRYEPCEDGNPA